MAAPKPIFVTSPLALSFAELAEFGASLRDSDRVEAEAAGYRDPMVGVLDSLGASEHRAWAAFHRPSDSVLLMAGLALGEDEGTLQPWMMASAKAGAKTVVRWAAIIFNSYMAKYRTAGTKFRNAVWMKAEPSHRLIERLGFRIDRRPESILQHPKTGELFYPFES